MPVVLRIDGLRFLFYSNEGTPREPPHIHVLQNRDEATAIPDKFFFFHYQLVAELPRIFVTAHPQSGRVRFLGLNAGLPARWTSEPDP